MIIATTQNLTQQVEKEYNGWAASAMGAKSSKDTKKDGIYAEIVSGKEQEENVPRLKVLLNAQLTSTAVDSLKDSEQMIHLLAENLIVEALKDKSTPKMFGEFMKYIFAYESTLSATRDLLYWALKTPDCYRSIEFLSAWQLKNYFNTYAPGQLSVAAQAWVVSVPSRRTVICPLLTWTLRQQEFVVYPLACLIKDTMPFARVSDSVFLRVFERDDRCVAAVD